TRPLFRPTFHKTAIERACGHDCQIESFGSHSQQERSHILKKRRSNGKAGHSPEINWLLECLFYVTKIDLGEFHETVCSSEIQETSALPHVALTAPGAWPVSID